MGRNQARRRGEVDHGRAGAIPEGQVRQPRVAGIESPPLRVPADVLPLPHPIHTVVFDGRMEIRRKLGSDVRNVGGKGAGRAFSQRKYGMLTHSDLYTSRQLVSLFTLTRLVREAGRLCQMESGKELGGAVKVILALCSSKLADLLNSLCGWQPSNDRRNPRPKTR